MHIIKQLSYMAILHDAASIQQGMNKKNNTLLYEIKF